MTIMLRIFFGVGLLLRGVNSSTLSNKSKTPRQGTCMHVAIVAWFSWSVASLPDGKTWGVFSAVLCKI